MYNGRVQDFNQHKQWLQDFFQGEFLHPNLLKIDSEKGKGSIFFYKIHPGIYFMSFNVIANEDIEFEINYSNSAYFDYVANFFSGDLKVRDAQGLKSTYWNGFYTSSKEVTVDNSVKKGEKLKHINIFFSEETFREIDNLEVSEYYLQRNNFISFYKETRIFKAFKDSLIEIYDYTQILQTKLLPVKMQELYYIFLKRLKHINVPNKISKHIITNDNINMLLNVRQQLIKDLQNKVDVDEVLKNYTEDKDLISELFHNLFGCSIYNYQSEYKMGVIKDDLLSDKYSISDLARKYGYDQVSHFSTSFKRRFNMSPSDYVNSRTY